MVVSSKLTLYYNGKVKGWLGQGIIMVNAKLPINSVGCRTYTEDKT